MSSLQVNSIRTLPPAYETKNRQTNGAPFQMVDQEDVDIQQALDGMKKAQEAKAEKQADDKVSLPKTLDPFPAMGMAQAKVLLKALAGEIRGTSSFTLSNTQTVSVNSLLPSAYV